LSASCQICPSEIAHEGLKDFTSRLLDQQNRQSVIRQFEEAFGNQLISLNSERGNDWQEALWKTGAWLDAPSPPKFENVDLFIGSTSATAPPIKFSAIFPIRYWIQAYEAHRYHVRVFAFSEYWEVAQIAAVAAFKQILEIDDEGLYDFLKKQRQSYVPAIPASLEKLPLE
jgi:hypothetical protein